VLPGMSGRSPCSSNVADMAMYARSVAPENRARASSLPPEIQEEIDGVLAGRSNALSLRADDYDLTEVPQAIRELTGLRSLSVIGAHIESLPSWLDELPDLEEIDIAYAGITKPPSFLSRVRWGVDAMQILSFGRQFDPSKIFAITLGHKASQQAIQHVFDLGRSGILELSEFSIEVDGIDLGATPEELKKQWAFFDVIESQLDEFLEASQQLRDLTIFGCPIGRIPEPIRGLRALEKVAMVAVWPAVIPDWLFEALELTSLDLGSNGLYDLPDSLGEARRLEHLRLDENQLRRIPSGVWRLTALESLDLQECPIEVIPADILRLERLSHLELGSFGSGSAVLGELTVPPPEIAVQGLDAIRRYWSQERDAGTDYLAEAKLLIVGEPGAGKTSLARKLLDPAYELDAAEDSTEGINVTAWQFPAAIRVRDQAGEHLLQRDFRVNIWDFGGQEIYHATHQFFLTRRSVYVLVTDERKEDTDFEYWLEIVSLLSDGSPLIIVQNRKQKRFNRVDFGGMRQRYPNLCGTLVLDLADNSGLAAAVSKIRRELELLPHIGTALPKTWRTVRLALEADHRSYIAAADFFRICEASGFTDREDMRQLGGYLHDLGICLFFQDDALLSKTVILKPEWGTAAVYRVLDDPQITRALGAFTRADLRRVWSDAAYEPVQDELLQLMVKFQLCFQVPGSDTYVAPQLLAPGQPAYRWDQSGNLELRYEYDVMPKGIVRRLTVALHYQIAGDLLWRNGAVFDYEGSMAEVIEVYRRRVLTLRIRGGDPRVLLGLIDHELGIIHRSYPGVRFKKFMPCDCEICSVSDEPTMFEVGELKDFARMGDQIQCRRSRRLRDPVELLRLLSPDPLERRPRMLTMDRPDATSREEPVQPEIFLSYSWGGNSETLADEIQHRMAERGVLIIRDKNEISYRDSIQQFMQRIGAGRCVIVILSKAYLESPNCMYELTQIASRPEFARRIYPIIMPDARIFDPISRLQYIKYWESKRAELDAAMKEIGQEHLEGIRDELDLYEDIRNTIGKITNVLKDMNTLTPDVHRGTNFEQLFTQLDIALHV
jgi:internalin A